MTRADIIRMAREAGAAPYTNRHYPDRTTYTFFPEQLKAFEDLVRADEREKLTDVAMKAAETAVVIAMALERESCAKIADTGHWNQDIAEAIRARGNT
jgi:hypothetical protein